ncbi:Uncharacterised protein [Capnocytophaga canimorsus]|nr:hypothetical protein CLV61_1720 [Capnocytophaga canimorsus]STA71434.1 Uncharacterised protein [Capnocytophaga canimorsus]
MKTLKINNKDIFSAMRFIIRKTKCTEIQNEMYIF